MAEERKEELPAVKQVHLDKAITQRRAMSAFSHAFVKVFDPEQVLPNEVLPDYLDDDETVEVDEMDIIDAEPEKLCTGKVKVICEDFRGVFLFHTLVFLVLRLTIMPATLLT